TWVVTHFREYQNLIADWSPYVQYRQRPFRGQTITVLPGGIRKTWNVPATDGKRPLRIWFVGGSSAWGVGARDEKTIPSLLSKEVSEWGQAVGVLNFGEIGYVSAQEYIWISLKLRDGERPDLVIVYDGVNDVLSAVQNGLAGGPENAAKRHQAFEDERSPFTQIVAASRGAIESSGLKRLARAISDRIRGRSGSIPPDPFWR